MALHRGTLEVTVSRGQLEVQRPNTPASHVGPTPTPATTPPSRLDTTITRTQARDALVGLGWKSSIARAAVDEACSHVGASAPLEVLIREALQRCPKPASAA